MNLAGERLMADRTLPKSANTELSKAEALRKVAEAMEIVRFGEIIVKMQGGKPVFVDVLMRERVG